MAHRWNAGKPIARFLAEADGRDPERALRRALGPYDLVLLGIGAIVGPTSVLLVMMFGQSRIFFAMSRGGLLPPLSGRVHGRFHSRLARDAGVA
jgi:amino acid transporter